jgi:hypothetical protein
LLLDLQLSYWRNIYSPTPFSYFQDEFNHFLFFLAYELFVHFCQYRSPLFAYKVWTLPIVVTAANSPISAFFLWRIQEITELLSLRCWGRWYLFKVTSDCRNGILRSWNKWTDAKILSDFMNWKTEFWESFAMNWNSRTCIIAAIIYITQRLCTSLLARRVGDATLLLRISIPR